MSKQATTAETVLLPEEDLVPLAVIAIETGENIDRVAHRFGDDVVLDDVGMRAVRADAARRFFAEKAEQKARQIEQSRRRNEEARQRKPVLVTVPAKDGMSPVEAMVSQDPAFSTPKDDFGPGYGSPARELLEAELAEGQRELAKRRAATAEKKRLAAKMKDDLS